jgi:hypothetical protein
MQTNVVNFSRRFQIWNYTVGHSELLLRSTKTSGVVTRVDVFFKNVAAIHLPTILDGLSVSEASAEETAELHIQVDPSRLEGRKVFAVRGSNFTGYVIAGVIAWHEDEREYHEPSRFSLTPSDD